MAVELFNHRPGIHGPFCPRRFAIKKILGRRPVRSVDPCHRQWILGSGGCKLMSGILLLNLYGSVYFLSTISVGEFEIA